MFKVGAFVTVTLSLMACGRQSPAPTTPSPPGGDVTARLVVTIDSLGSAVAIPSVSRIRFDASGSVATSGPLQYKLDYGDHTAASDAVSEHIYDTPGTYEATLTVIDAQGRRASTSHTVIVRAVEGSWFHFAYNPQSHSAELRRLTLTQSGRTVSGELSGPDGAPTAVTGTIEGERTLRLNAAGVHVQGTIPGVVFPVDSAQPTIENAALALSGFPNIADQPLPFRPIVGTPTSPPPVARLHIQIDSFGSRVAIQNLSPVRYSGDGSEGDSLMYVIEFGDGEFATSSSAVHPCTAEGAWIEGKHVDGRLSVVDRFGRRAFASRSFRCAALKDPFGLICGWYSVITNPANGRQEWRKIAFTKHIGLTVEGLYRHPEGNVSHFTGTLSGERSIRLVLDGGGIDFRGEVFLDFQSSLSPEYISLVPTGGSANGMTLKFSLIHGTYCPT